MEQFWPVITQLAVAIVGLGVGGAFTVPIIARLKAIFKTTGWKTNVLVGVFATILTLAVFVVEGQLSPETVVGENWGTLLVAIVAAAEIRFRQLQDELKEG